MLKVGTSSDMEIIIQYTNKNEKQNKYHTIGTQSNINIVDRGKIYTPKSHGPFTFLAWHRCNKIFIPA
jgi:hypothetical protein